MSQKQAVHPCGPKPLPRVAHALAGERGCQVKQWSCHSGWILTHFIRCCRGRRGQEPLAPVKTECLWRAVCQGIGELACVTTAGGNAALICLAGCPRSGGCQEGSPTSAKGWGCCTIGGASPGHSTRVNRSPAVLPRGPVALSHLRGSPFEVARPGSQTAMSGAGRGRRPVITAAASSHPLGDRGYNSSGFLKHR